MSNKWLSQIDNNLSVAVFLWKELQVDKKHYTKNVKSRKEFKNVMFCVMVRHVECNQDMKS